MNCGNSMRDFRPRDHPAVDPHPASPKRYRGRPYSVPAAGRLLPGGDRSRSGVGDRRAWLGRGAVLAVAVALLSSGQVSRAQQTATRLVSNTRQTLANQDQDVRIWHLAFAFRTGTGRDSGGYAFTALDVMFSSEPTAPSDVKLSIWDAYESSDSGGGWRPFQKLFDFDNPSTFKTGDNKINTFTRSKPFYLHDDRVYFLVAESDGLTSTEYSLSATSSDAQDLIILFNPDPGWSIFNSALVDDAPGGEWGEQVFVHPSNIPVFAIHGYRLDPLVTNLAEDRDSSHNVGAYLAQGYRVDDGANSNGYDLHSVAVAFEKVPDDPEDITVSLYTQKRKSGSSDRIPDRKLFDFHNPPVFRRGGDNAFPAPEGTTLEPDGHLVVIKRESGDTISVRNTDSIEEDGLPGLIMRDEVQVSSNGRNWSDEDGAALMALYGKRRTEPIPRPLVTNHGERDRGRKA